MSRARSLTACRVPWISPSSSPSQLVQCRRTRCNAARCAYSLDDEEAELCRIDEKCIYFVTGNAMKEKEVNAIFSEVEDLPFSVSHVDIDLPELQGDVLEIARHKCLEAASQVDSAVLVEDTSLCFTALKGLPGPYIKWFVQVRGRRALWWRAPSPPAPRDSWLTPRPSRPPRATQTLGNEGLYSLLADHSDHSAYCQCILGFSAGPGAEPLLFVGRTPGQIVRPSGKGGFGWDAIFVPDGHEAPFSTMEMEAKNRISHRAVALRQFIDYLHEHEDAVFEAIEKGGGDLEPVAAPGDLEPVAAPADPAL